MIVSAFNPLQDLVSVVPNEIKGKGVPLTTPHIFSLFSDSPSVVLIMLRQNQPLVLPREPCLLRPPVLPRPATQVLRRIRRLFHLLLLEEVDQKDHMVPLRHPLALLPQQGNTLCNVKVSPCSLCLISYSTGLTVRLISSFGRH